VVERKVVEENVSYIGPDLSVGPLPTVVYFSLSDKDSLETDPFNQYPLFCVERGMRVFSFMLPCHEPPTRPKVAVDLWLDNYLKGNDLITPFLEWSAEKIKQYTPEGKTALAGLSRGVFIAMHLSAKLGIDPIVGFAPMLKMRDAHLFSLKEHIDTLCSKRIRFYIGNRDVRADTDFCFEMVRELTEAAYEKRIRSPQIEMTISPSIGYEGHGTKKELFEAGAEWTKQMLSS